MPINRICIWGDSIAYGLCDTEGGWVARLRRFFESTPNLDFIETFNLGIGGDNTDGLLKRFKVEASARKPDLILFAIGINDSVWYDTELDVGIPPDRFESNLTKLIFEAEAISKRIVFIGLTDVNEENTQPLKGSRTGKSYSNEIIEKYDSVIKKLARENGLGYLSLKSLLENTDLYDGLHPNDKGHQKIFEKIKDFLVTDNFLNAKR